MKALFLGVLLLPFILNAQRPNDPSFDKSVVYFNTAKFSSTSPGSTKYSEPVYKDAFIKFDGAENGFFMTATIDIPDKFYVKDATVSATSYSRSDDTNEYFSFSFTSGNKYVSVALYYFIGEKSPYQILVIGTDNILAKPPKRFVYKLTELKD